MTADSIMQNMSMTARRTKSGWKIKKSIGEKLDVMKNNHLAGASFWKLGYEKNTIWDTIAEYMN